jgi:hypothetical protein
MGEVWGTAPRMHVRGHLQVPAALPGIRGFETGETQKKSESCEKALIGFKPRFLGCPDSSPVAVSTELSKFKFTGFGYD